MIAPKAQIVTINGASMRAPDRNALRNVMRRDLGAGLADDMKVLRRKNLSAGGARSKYVFRVGGKLWHFVDFEEHRPGAAIRTGNLHSISARRERLHFNDIARVRRQRKRPGSRRRI